MIKPVKAGKDAWISLYSELEKTKGLNLDQVGEFIKEERLLFLSTGQEGQMVSLGSMGVVVQAMANGHISLNENSKLFTLTRRGKRHITLLERLAESQETKPLNRRL